MNKSLPKKLFPSFHIFPSELSSVSRHDKEQRKQYEELTPLPVATFLAGEIFSRVGDGILRQDRSYVKVYDPACGRGCLLLL